MNSEFKGFVDWCKTQAEAGRKVGRSRALICQIVNGKCGVSKTVAIRAEQASGGLYRAARMLGLESDREFAEH